MRIYKQCIGVVTGIAMLLSVGCHRDELIDDNKSGTGELTFTPTIGMAQTAGSRAAESDNSLLQRASVHSAASRIAINTYTGVAGVSLKPYFDDQLEYTASGNWELFSGAKRFLPQGGMNLYAHYATNDKGVGDMTGIEYIEATDTEYPTLEFTVAKDEDTQTDLIAAKVDGITNSAVHIPLRHILSQINFGVKGLDQNKIKIKNIKINKVAGDGSFDYGTWLWSANNPTASYPYYFPDRRAGQGGAGGNYLTSGVEDDSKNSYIFGDGGKFGPGKQATFLYAQTTAGYATKDATTTALNNSLILLPQSITTNANATVTFDYEIMAENSVIRSGTNVSVRLDAYYDWQPNMRYVYIFKFDDPAKVTFDVLVEPWVEVGNIETEELNSVSLFENYVRTMKPGDSYDVPLGALSSNFICDWSLRSLDNSFTSVNQTFSLSFNSPLSFEGGKSIIINPPFGFKASVTRLRAPGKVTFTPLYPYYTTAEAINLAIKNSGNYIFSVHESVKLDDVSFTGSNSAERSLSLRYLSPYGAPLPSDKWRMSDQNTAVCFPNDYALLSNSVPFSYTVYTVQGLKEVLNWMNTDNIPNPGGSTTTATYTQRMQTNINLAQVGRYNLAEVYNNGTNGKQLFVPIGTQAIPYSGTFDGKGATISNLYINIGYAGQAQGFFGALTGKVLCVNLSDVSVAAPGDTQVAGLVGFNVGSGQIQGCSVQGSVQGAPSEYGLTGGIVGQNNAFVHACSSTATIIGGSSAGGVVGQNWGQIWSCYATNGKNVVGANSNGDAAISTSYYVAPTDIGTNPKGVTRLPSIAMLNGRIAQLNETIIYVPAHFVSGSLNETPPLLMAGSPAARKKEGVLKGTFIQNWFGLTWDQNRWNAEMALLATVGMEYLVIDQVMEFTDFSVPNKYMAWYGASSGVLVNDGLDISPSNSLEYCMKACRAHGIKLFIGTFFDKRYWDNGAAVKGKEREWNNCITTANRVMDELVAKYFHNGAGNYNDVLAGWYFPYEVDDLSFQTTPAKTILKTGIKTAMDYRNTRAANVQKPYLFSPFMNGSGGHAIGGTMNATDYAALWRDIISTTGFRSGDILSPQDCIGIDKLTIADLGVWMPALKEATKAVTGVEFWINVELFDFSNTPKLINEQLPENKKHTNTLISFSYTIYYSPNSGVYRQGDHDAYKAYYDEQ